MRYALGPVVDREVAEAFSGARLVGYEGIPFDGVLKPVYRVAAWRKPNEDGPPAHIIVHRAMKSLGQLARTPVEVDKMRVARFSMQD